MKKSLLFLAAFVLSVSALQAAEEAAVRVYILKHKRVEEAALLIRPHLSDSASITLIQKMNAMTVTDRAEKLDQVARVLAAFDVPPRGFTFAVKLVRARADVPEGSIAREIGGLGAKLKSMFQFNDYSLIDSVVVRVAEGARVETQFGDQYMLAFTVRNGAGSELLLSPFVLSKIYRTGDRRGVNRRPLYRSSMPVTLSQTLVIGASRQENSNSALILILHAQELPRGDVIEQGAPGAKAAEKTDKPNNKSDKSEKKP